MNIREFFAKKNASAPVADDSVRTVSESLAQQKISVREAAAFLHSIPELNEAYTQADIELALDDRGWLVGGKKMAGELDPLSRTVQINKSRYYWLRDPLFRQAVRLWTDYGLGADALTYKAQDNSVQKQINKFMRDRRNRKLLSAQGQQRLSRRLLTDGEIFFAMFEDGTVRTFDPLQVTDILCKSDDDETVLAYRRKMNNDQIAYYRDWTVADDDQTPVVDPITKKEVTTFEKGVVVYHLAFEAFEKRGTGLGSASVNWSREHRRFMEARTAITQSLATFASKLTVKGGQQQLNKIKAGLESTFATSGTQGGTERNPQQAPGSTWLQNDGVNLEPTSRSTGAGDARSDADQLKLMVSAGTGIMLHYFGDPSTGNLATATAMELPMLKMFESYQKLWKDAFRDLFSIVLDEDPEEEPSEIAVDLPPILADDLAKLGTFLTSATTMFPELKVPQVLQMLLTSLGVNNIDEVMEDIQAKREEIDAAQADLAAKGIMTDKNGKPVATPTAPGTKAGATPPGPSSTDQTEAYTKLAEALGRIADRL